MEENRFVLRNARAIAEDYIRRSVLPGDHVIDATMGNGGDTEMLCRLVGETGKVDAFDVQEQAVESTRTRLERAGLSDRAVLHCMGHEKMEQAVTGPVQAVLFNFGWLPGGDHSVTTKVETTLQAVRAALRLICRGGIVSLCIYPGHEEGHRELEALLQFCAGLPVREYNVLHHHFLNAADYTPNLILIQKNLV